MQALAIAGLADGSPNVATDLSSVTSTYQGPKAKLYKCKIRYHRQQAIGNHAAISNRQQAIGNNDNIDNIEKGMVWGRFIYNYIGLAIGPCRIAIGPLVSQPGMLLASSWAWRGRPPSTRPSPASVSCRVYHSAASPSYSLAVLQGPIARGSRQI